MQISYASTLRPFNKARDTPFFWHIPKAGGTSVKGYLSECIGLVEASEVGIQGGHENDTTLEVVRKPSGRKYVNVDTTTKSGLIKARDMGLGRSRIADVIFSGWPHEGASLFSIQQSGVMFTIFRHPVERAVSMFYYLQDAHWEPTYRPGYKNITLAEYARSDQIEDNWMTRILANKMREPLNQNDLTLAKGIVREKMIVGLTNQIDESYRRFDKYFGWQSAVQYAKECRDKYVLNSSSSGNKHQHQEVEENSLEWSLIMARNTFDFELYEFARALFHNEQKLMLGDPKEHSKTINR